MDRARVFFGKRGSVVFVVIFILLVLVGVVIFLLNRPSPTREDVPDVSDNFCFVKNFSKFHIVYNLTIVTPQNKKVSSILNRFVKISSSGVQEYRFYQDEIREKIDYDNGREWINYSVLDQTILRATEFYQDIEDSQLKTCYYWFDSNVASNGKPFVFHNYGVLDIIGIRPILSTEITKETKKINGISCSVTKKEDLTQSCISRDYCVVLEKVFVEDGVLDGINHVKGELDYKVISFEEVDFDESILNKPKDCMLTDPIITERRV